MSTTTEKLAEAVYAALSERERKYTSLESVRAVLAAYTAEQAKTPALQDIEQYRMQMAGISTAALGYWKEGDSIHPDYDTLALHDVAKLYAKYDALYREQAQAREVEGLTEAERDSIAQRVVRYPILSPMDIVDEVERTLAARWGLKIKEQSNG